MKRILMTLPLLGLTGMASILNGCTAWNSGVASVNNYSASQMAAQQKNVEGVNDNVARAWAAGACAIPYGEIVRNGTGNPNFPKAIIELCGAPSGTTIISTQPVPSATTTVPTIVVPVP